MSPEPRPSIRLLPAFLVALVPALRAQSEPAFAPAVRAAVLDAQEREHVPGLSCAVGVAGEVVFAEGFGIADLENAVPATAATVYRLASISKPITAVAAMQLAERGRLDLDADVHSLVAAWPEKPWPVTTRLLLGHQGGVRHYKPRELEVTEHYDDQTAALVRFAGDPLLHQPGTAYVYSTFGFNLVGAVVEQASGQTLAAYVREQIAAPSGAATLQDDDVRRIVVGRAAGYVRVGGELRNSRLMDSSYKLGGGGFVCSAPDLVRFANALLAGRLVKPASLEAMWTAGRLANGEATTYGLGFGVGRREGRRVVSHSGAQSRVSTMLYILPEERIVVVVLANLEGLRLSALASRIADEVAASGAGAGRKSSNGGR